MTPEHRPPVVAYVAVGANLGDAQAAVLAAMQALGGLAHTTVTRQSSLYRSAPVDASGPDFINAVVQVSTELCAPQLLAGLQHIEREAGRERPYRNAPRTLDLDLLLYGDGCISSAALTVPHPRMGLRAFVLLPLAEIAPGHVAAMQLDGVRGQRIEKL